MNNYRCSRHLSSHVRPLVSRRLHRQPRLSMQTARRTTREHQELSINFQSQIADHAVGLRLNAFAVISVLSLG